MTILQLLNKANEGYPDNSLGSYYTETGEFNHEGSGDTLAQFIVSELIGTYDPKLDDEQQQAIAYGLLEQAVDDLSDVIQKLYD